MEEQNFILISSDKFNTLAAKLDAISESVENMTMNLKSSKEVCKLLHISMPTLLKYSRNGYLPAIKLDKKTMYRMGDITKFLKEHTHGAK